MFTEDEVHQFWTQFGNRDHIRFRGHDRPRRRCDSLAEAAILATQNQALRRGSWPEMVDRAGGRLLLTG